MFLCPWKVNIFCERSDADGLCIRLKRIKCSYRTQDSPNCCQPNHTTHSSLHIAILVYRQPTGSSCNLSTIKFFEIV